jgi:hypothetical protein
MATNKNTTIVIVGNGVSNLVCRSGYKKKSTGATNELSSARGVKRVGAAFGS